MQQAKKLTPSTPPSEPHLKLRRASIDQVDEPSQEVVVEGEEASVVAGTVLPWRCAKCGDAMDTLPVRTIRGGIKYRLCRDHVVSTVAQLLSGLALITVGVMAVMSKLLGDPIFGLAGMAFCFLAACAGGALIYRSLPVLTSRETEGRYRLRRLHAELIDDLKRSLR